MSANEREKRISERIRLWGIVQGVGFRPFVSVLAHEFEMKGEVLNLGGLVEIYLTDSVERIDNFLSEMKKRKPERAEIVHIKRERVEYREYADFRIVESRRSEESGAIIPADFSICPACLAELGNPKNRRYAHPFISCMACGPRYTIIDRLPYDRENTAMVDFPLCAPCESEYTDREDRRYHAQTVSCHDCGPDVFYLEYNGRAAVRGAKAATEKACASLRSGKIVCLKAVGGFNLLCDPLNAEAAARLRELKGREAKPFALMFEKSEDIEKYALISEAERRLLESSARPIVLLERRESAAGGADGELFDGGEGQIGAFLPSMGFQYLLLAAYGGPLIATSANVSELPIIYGEPEAFSLMERSGGLVSAVIYNDRAIRVSVDDSVARIVDGQPQLIRRSKGYAPLPLYFKTDGAEAEKLPDIQAFGGFLKSSFVLAKGGLAYASEYFGDLDSLENQRRYEASAKRLSEILDIDAEILACDLHPLYPTAKMAEDRLKELKEEGRAAELIYVQHHHAHVASVMGEHGLRGPLIGVAMDGTGYGTDGAIWGSEFLICENAAFERAYHMKYVDMAGGDSSMKDAGKSALCLKYAWEQGYGKSAAESEFIIDIEDILKYAERRGLPRARGADEKLLFSALSKGVGTVKSSSMGRLFDAVSALLGFKEYNDYEGQCAILLEEATRRALKAGKAASEAERLALNFHEKIANEILLRCKAIRNERDISAVALTGGVFQNKILMEKSLSLLREAGFEVFYNISLPPNDGGIAFGQAYIALLRQLSKSKGPAGADRGERNKKKQAKKKEQR